MAYISERSKSRRNDYKQLFHKKLLSVLPHLHPYVKHRIYIAESTGVLPRNMYCSNGIIDDAIVKLYEEERLDLHIDTLSLELQLFRIADSLLDELYTKEGWHKSSISTSYFLRNELSKLEENYNSDADNELIMSEECTDTSYHQASEGKISFMYDDADSAILKIFDSEKVTAPRKLKLLGKFYSWLPMETSKIIDLFVFGKLNFEEISKVKEIPVQHVKQTIIDVRKSFRKNLI